MTINKLTLCPLLLVALLFAGYPSLSMAEKLTCDVTDAPNVDLTTITASLETRINTLTQLETDLIKSRAELDSAATKEQFGAGLLALAASLKTASAITLSVAGAVATGPEALATTVLATTARFITDAINSQNKNQDKVLIDAFLSYGINNLRLIGRQFGDLAKYPRFGKAWRAFAVYYTTVTNMNALLKTDINTNLSSQISGIDKLINKISADITVLKNNLSKMKSLIAADETKVDNGFISIIEKYKNKNSCSQCDKPPVKVGNLEVQSCDYNQCPAKYWDGGNHFYCTWVEAIAAAQSYGSGWHLPTKEELNTLWLNKYVVGGFAVDTYWSATEGDSSYAWFQGFSRGFQYNYNKTDSYRVRAVRAY